MSNCRCHHCDGGKSCPEYKSPAQLRRELKEMTEQRDGLAEALEEMRYGHTDKAERMYQEAIQSLPRAEPQEQSNRTTQPIMNTAEDKIAARDEEIKNLICDRERLRNDIHWIRSSAQNTITKLEARIERLRTITPDGWQPIASVPLGKDVLLHVPFEVGGASRLLTIGMILTGNCDHGCTHWMPLPSLPNSQADQPED